MTRGATAKQSLKMCQNSLVLMSSPVLVLWGLGGVCGRSHPRLFPLGLPDSSAVSSVGDVISVNQ